MDFTSFLYSVSGMESSFGATSNNVYGMTPAAGNTTPLALAQSNYNTMSGKLGRPPSGFEQYLGWQQGATGATRLLQADPNALASSVVPVQNLTGNIGASSGLDAATMTVGQFTGYIGSKWSAVGGSGSPSSAAAPAGDSTSNVMGWAGHQLVRVGVIVLGMVFVAGGLGMFAIGILANPEGIAPKIGEIQEGRLRRRSLKASIAHDSREAVTVPAPEIHVTNLVRQKTEPTVSSRRRILREGKLPPKRIPRAPRRSTEEITNERLAKAAVKKAKKGAITVKG